MLSVLISFINCNVHVLHKKIFSNKFDLVWTRTLFLYRVSFTFVKDVYRGNKSWENCVNFFGNCAKNICRIMAWWFMLPPSCEFPWKVCSLIIFDWPRLAANTSLYSPQLYIILTTPTSMVHHGNILFWECYRTSYKYSFPQNAIEHHGKCFLIVSGQG